MIEKSFLPKQVFAKLKTVYEGLEEHEHAAKHESPFADSLKNFLEVSGSERELDPGEILFIENAPADNLYWIETGVLAILQGDLEDPRLLTFRHPGQVVGEIALIEKIQRTATVAALKPTRLKSLSKEKFQALLGLIPDVGLELMRLLSARLREVEPAEYSSGFYDHLTGALSRRTFNTRLLQEIERAQLYNYSFSVVFIDLDYFKDVNDTYGHVRGDQVLVTIVHRIMENLRTTDLLFRYGGDEFVLILQGIDQLRGPVLVERLIEEAGTTPIPGEPPLTITFSAGIAYFPADANDPDTLLEIADKRLYQAKGSGRGQISDGRHLKNK